MKEILSYTGDYFRYVNKKLLVLCTLQTTIFVLAFVLPYFFCELIERKKFFDNKPFLILLVVAPAIFSLKMALRTEFPFSNDLDWNEYWNQVYYWPVRLLIVTAILFLVWRVS